MNIYGALILLAGVAFTAAAFIVAARCKLRSQDDEESTDWWAL